MNYQSERGCVRWGHRECRSCRKSCCEMVIEVVVDNGGDSGGGVVFVVMNLNVKVQLQNDTWV